MSDFSSSILSFNIAAIASAVVLIAMFGVNPLMLKWISLNIVGVIAVLAWRYTRKRG